MFTTSEDAIGQVEGLTSSNTYCLTVSSSHSYDAMMRALYSSWFTLERRPSGERQAAQRAAAQGCLHELPVVLPLKWVSTSAVTNQSGEFIYFWRRITRS